MSRHALIREATAASHAALDCEVTRAGLLDSAAGYAEFLQRLHAFHTELERVAGQHLRRALTDWSITPRRDWLASDLAALRIPALAPEPEAATVPPSDTEACSLGALYVLLGATLGARILVRRISALPLVPHERATRYLSQLAGCDRWPRFIRLLDGLAHVDEPAMIRAADGMFDRIRTHVSRQVVT